MAFTVGLIAMAAPFLLLLMVGSIFSHRGQVLASAASIQETRLSPVAAPTDAAALLPVTTNIAVVTPTSGPLYPSQEAQGATSPQATGLPVRTPVPGAVISAYSPDALPKYACPADSYRTDRVLPAREPFTILGWNEDQRGTVYLLIKDVPGQPQEWVTYMDATLFLSPTNFRDTYPLPSACQLAMLEIGVAIASTSEALPLTPALTSTSVLPLTPVVTSTSALPLTPVVTSTSALPLTPSVALTLSSEAGRTLDDVTPVLPRAVTATPAFTRGTVTITNDQATGQVIEHASGVRNPRIAFTPSEVVLTGELSVGSDRTQMLNATGHLVLEGGKLYFEIDTVTVGTQDMSGAPIYDVVEHRVNNLLLDMLVGQNVQQFELRDGSLLIDVIEQLR